MLGSVYFDFLMKTLTWDGATIEMEKRRRNEYNSTGSYEDEPSSIQEISRRALHILDAEYEAADLNSIVQNCTGLEADQRIELTGVLHRHRKLFDGTLGSFIGKEESLEIKRT